MPREVHETYTLNPKDPDGEPILTGYVVIARESEWDDNSRQRAIALTEYEDSVCRCGCGLPREIAHKKQAFDVDTVVCYAGRAMKQLEDIDREKHKDDPAWFYGRHYVAWPAKPPPDDD
jgi:hypothetical protein